MRLGKRRTSRGFAFIVLLAFMTVGALYLFVSQLDAAAIERRREEATTRALAEAKAALIARSVLDNNRPGSLPCPDADSDGNADGMVGNQCPSHVGRLPWRTLKVGDLRDGFGEQLWYALSSSLRDDNSAKPINHLTPMAMTLDGTGVAAIVIAPGPPIGDQARPSNTVADYLDGANGDGDSAYVSTPPVPNRNDRLLAISRSELFSAVAIRVAREIRGYPGKGLKGYFDASGTLPCAATVALDFPVAGAVSGYIPYKDPNIGFDSATSNLLLDNMWLDVATYNVPGCGLPGTNAATIVIGTKAVSLSFP